jgi:transmembrane sensor
MNQQVKNYHFSAWFKRSSSINEVINILEKTKKISLDLKGRILTVKDISRN